MHTPWAMVVTVLMVQYINLCSCFNNDSKNRDTANIIILVPSRGASSALTLHFASYSSQQLLQVLQARLSPLYDTSECPEAAEHANRFLPTATLTLLTKKIASQTGDVRALFEVLRSNRLGCHEFESPSCRCKSSCHSTPHCLTRSHSCGPQGISAVR
jgi:hypothetical protein